MNQYHKDIDKMKLHFFVTIVAMHVVLVAAQQPPKENIVADFVLLLTTNATNNAVGKWKVGGIQQHFLHMNMIHLAQPHQNNEKLSLRIGQRLESSSINTDLRQATSHVLLLLLCLGSKIVM